MNKMNLKIAAAALFVLSLLLVCNAQQPAFDALDRTVTVVINDASPHQILGILSKQASVAIGIEEAPQATARRDLISISVRKGTVRDVLDAIVKADNRYKWEVVDRVINVFPSDAQGSISRVVMTNFCVSDTKVEEVGFAITDTSEVRAELAKLGMSDSRLLEKQGAPNLQTRITITRLNVTVAEILNELIRSHYISYWAVVRYGDRSQYIAVLLA